MTDDGYKEAYLAWTAVWVVPRTRWHGVGFCHGTNDRMRGWPRLGLHYPEGKFRADGVAIATKDAFVVVYLGFVVYQG